MLSNQFPRGYTPFLCAFYSVYAAIICYIVVVTHLSPLVFGSLWLAARYFSLHALQRR